MHVTTYVHLIFWIFCDYIPNSEIFWRSTLNVETWKDSQDIMKSETNTGRPSCMYFKNKSTYICMYTWLCNLYRSEKFQKAYTLCCVCECILHDIFISLQITKYPLELSTPCPANTFCVFHPQCLCSNPLLCLWHPSLISNFINFQDSAYSFLKILQSTWAKLSFSSLCISKALLVHTTHLVTCINIRNFLYCSPLHMLSFHMSFFSRLVSYLWGAKSWDTSDSP